MKKLLYLFVTVLVFSCGESNTSSINEKMVSQLKSFETKEALETSSKQFIEDYIRDINTDEWEARILKYLPPNSEAFLEQHAAFRVSFPNYKINIEHATADGNEVTVWLNITANYAVTYDFEDTDFKEAIKGIEADNQSLSWDEVWYFDVVDGKFGDKWDFLKDQYVILKDLNAL